MAVIVLLALLTLLGLVAMLPSTEEKAAVMIEKQDYDGAIDLLAHEGDLTPHETFTLVELYRLSGDDDDAAALLEKTLADNPDQSSWALGELIEIYRHQRAFADEARVLEQAFARAPEAASYRRLLALYRLLGLQDAERTLIESAQASGLASRTDTERLAWIKRNGTAAAPAAVWSSDGQDYSLQPQDREATSAHASPSIAHRF